MDKNSPIGIFDSGIGGLTVAHAIHKVLPKESLIYFGDTAHFPYGDKSPDSIRYYAIRIAQFLLDKKCKTIVIACNTASSFAYETVKDFVGNRAVVVNVIDPVVEKVCTLKSVSKVGVIGTKGTIRSDIYAKKIKQIKPSLEVASIPTPLLAPMIEEGFFNNKISTTVINSYLSRPKLKRINLLILACTHYPLIKDEIGSIYKNNIPIFDSAEIVALELKRLLTKKNLLSPARTPKNKFYISDYTEAFKKTSSVFFGSKIQLEKAGIWK